MSFRSRKERIINDWKINVAYNEDLNITEDYVTYTLSFLADGTFESTVTDTADSVHLQLGLWDFVNDDEQVRLLYTEPLVNPDRSYFDILRLKEDELWVHTLIDSINYEFRFLPR